MPMTKEDDGYDTIRIIRIHAGGNSMGHDGIFKSKKYPFKFTDLLHAQ